MKSCLLFLLVPLFFALVGKPSLRAAEIRREEPRAGGPCEYHRYAGQAEITSVRRIAGPQDQGGEKYEVKFSFTPKEEIKESFARVEGKEFLLEINYTTSLSREFIEQHKIRPGSLIDGCLKAIVKGTCTPTLFEFPSLSSK
jgi:hypothetical protein